MNRYLAIDIGGSHIACALVRGGMVERRAEIAVPATPTLETLLPELQGILADLRAGDAVTGVAVAFPGLIDPRSGQVVSTPTGKYEDAVGFDFAGWAKEHLDLPIMLEVDGRMALLGERTYGALIGQDDAVLLGLGTGIGSAALMGGTIVRGRTGHASVLAGHMTIDTDGPLCRCGNIGCAEAIASTWALPGLIAALPRQGRLHTLANPNLKAVLDLARAGDEGAQAVRAICLTAWATVALNLVTAYDASYVLVTGGAAAAAEVVPFIQDHVRQHVWCLGAPPVVVRGALGSDAALLAATPLWEDRHDQL